MNKKNQRYREEIVERKIILELSGTKKSYEEFCEGMWKKKLDEISSNDTLLHLVRVREWEEERFSAIDENPFMEFKILNLLYDIVFTEKNINEKTFSISVENYLLGKIMNEFSLLCVPLYRQFELSQQLRYNVKESFYNKIIRWSFGLHHIDKSSNEFLTNAVYNYVKYHRNVRHFRDDATVKHLYEFIAKQDLMGDILKYVRNIHYKESKDKNYLLFYLLYLTVYEWLELYIIYDHSEIFDCFKVCDAKSVKNYINRWCTVMWLYDILIKSFDVLWIKGEPVLSKSKVWADVLDDIIEASEKCTTFTYRVNWSWWLPMMGEVSFIHTDPKKYHEMKKYAWDYWWVIPMSWMWDEKILDWKKKLNYKKARKKDTNN